MELDFHKYQNGLHDPMENKNDSSYYENKPIQIIIMKILSPKKKKKKKKIMKVFR